MPELLSLRDRLLALPQEPDEQFWNEMEASDEECCMPYMPGVERRVVGKGRRITDLQRLRLLQRVSIKVESQDAFVRQIEE